MPSRFDFVGFFRHELCDANSFMRGSLPPHLVASQQEFTRLWGLHPPEPPEILIHGRRVRTPRWQEVFGVDYHFTGSRHAAHPIPPDFYPWLEWGREVIEPQLNGVVVNWYDAALGHYIGPHRDSTKKMIPGTPIVMISLGHSRTFVLRRWKGEEKVELSVANGAVVVLPYATNLRWTHEIKRLPRRTITASEFAQPISRYRISITLRAFCNS